MRAVRIATSDDVPALARVQRETVLVAYAGIFPPHADPPALDALEREWEAALGEPTFRAFLADEDGVAVGTVAVRADPQDALCGQLRRLHVMPDRWGRGLGSTLYDAAMSAVRSGGYREAGLWVLEANRRARSFYERRGWSLVPGQILELEGPGTKEVRYRLGLVPVTEEHGP